MQNRSINKNYTLDRNTANDDIEKFIVEQKQVCENISLITSALSLCIANEEYDKATDLIKKRELLLNQAVLLKGKIYYFTTKIQAKEKMNSIFLPVFAELQNSNDLLSMALDTKKNEIINLIKKATMQKAIALYK